MRTNRKLIQKARWALAVALMLWCAGAGCMLVSYAHGASMANPEAAAAPANAPTWAGLSASAGAHSCCKAHHSSQHAPAIAHSHAPVAAELNEVGLPESSSPSDAASCCPLTSGTFLVTARQSVRDDRASEALKPDAPVLALGYAYATPRALPLRLPDQEQAYLRCCSFLI